MHKISETDLQLLTVNLRKKFNEGYQLGEYSSDQFRTDFGAVGRGAADGLTFGTADNIVAGVDTGVGQLGKALGQDWGASDYKTNLQNQQAQTAYAKNKSTSTPSWQGFDSIPDWVPLAGKGQHNINMYDVGNVAGALTGAAAVASKVGGTVARTAVKPLLAKAGVDITKGVGKYALPSAVVAGDVSAQLGAGHAVGVGKEVLDKAVSGLTQGQIDYLARATPTQIQWIQQNINLRFGTNLPITGKVDAELINTLVNNKITIPENKESGGKFMKTQSQIILENKVKSLRETIMKVSEVSLPRVKVPEPHIPEPHSYDPHSTDPRFTVHDVPPGGTTSIDDLMREPPMNPASEARAAELAKENAELEQQIAAAKAAKAISPAEQAQLDKMKMLKGEQRKQFILDIVKKLLANPLGASAKFLSLIIGYFAVTTGYRAVNIADVWANRALGAIDPSKAVTPPVPTTPPSANAADEEAKYQAWLEAEKAKEAKK
jgi:F0F1-type ATP synthase delta subunit